MYSRVQIAASASGDIKDVIGQKFGEMATIVIIDRRGNTVTIEDTVALAGLEVLAESAKMSLEDYVELVKPKLEVWKKECGGTIEKVDNTPKEQPKEEENVGSKEQTSSV